MKQTQKPHLTTRQLADRLHLHINTVRRFTREGRLPKPISIGGHWRYPIESIEQWEKANYAK